MTINVETVFHLIRLIVYSWVAYEVAVTAFLYFTANQRMKSPIIKQLSQFLVALAIYMAIIAIMPILAAVGSDTYDDLAMLLVVPAFFMGRAVRDFRNISVDFDNGKAKPKIMTKE